MALLTAFASIASSISGAYAKGAGTAAQIEAQNEENRAQFNMNKEITARSLGTLAYRVDKQASDLNRNKINRNIQIKRAAMVAKGDQVTEAARIGSAGKRPDVNRRSVDRTAANAVSDSNLQAQTALDNLTVTLHDTAYQMIDQLQGAVPQQLTGPSTMSNILGAASAGLNSYMGLTPIEKAEIASLFPTKGPDINYGDEATPGVIGYGGR